MRADLQNYLMAKSQDTYSNSSRRRADNRYNSRLNMVMASPISDNYIDLRSDRLVRNTPLLAGSLKPLHDSCYVGPEQNPRVIQDGNPAKSLAWKQALERHEAEIAKQKDFNTQVLTHHFKQVKHDED